MNFKGSMKTSSRRPVHREPAKSDSAPVLAGGVALPRDPEWRSGSPDSIRGTFSLPQVLRAVVGAKTEDSVLAQPMRHWAWLPAPADSPSLPE